MSVRLYGPCVGYGSFARVIAGMREGLHVHHRFAGVVPIDAYDEEVSYPGHGAPTAVYVGPPSGARMMQTRGVHASRYALLAPNSSWLPEQAVEAIERAATHFLVPSRWAAEVLRGYTKHPIAIWRHGVAEEFAPNELDYDTLVRLYDMGEFNVLHMASSTMQRKGTRELVRAWVDAANANLLGAAPKLNLVVDGSMYDLLNHPSIVPFGSRLNMRASLCASFYRKHHLVCQPSRGEAFGMVPLEARACGVPAAATVQATGHAEHMSPTTEGVVPIPTGADAPIDDGPGAMAPLLHVNDIRDALVAAHTTWKALAEEAQAAAPAVRKQWSWKNVTADWLRTEGI